jgi:hypothetical protein
MEFQLSKQRKDPKTMSVEELDEYITQNRKHKKDSSLNTSINSTSSYNNFLQNKQKEGKSTQQNNQSNQIESESYSNAILSLKDKIDYLEGELVKEKRYSDSLKKELFQQKELYENEILYLSHLKSELERELSFTNNENIKKEENFQKKLSQINKEKSYFESNCLVLQKEKEKHIETNALEQDDLKDRVCELEKLNNQKESLLREASNELSNFERLFYEMNQDLGNVRNENEGLKVKVNELERKVKVYEKEKKENERKERREKEKKDKDMRISKNKNMKYKEIDDKFNRLSNSKIGKSIEKTKSTSKSKSKIKDYIKKEINPQFKNKNNTNQSQNEMISRYNYNNYNNNKSHLIDYNNKVYSNKSISNSSRMVDVGYKHEEENINNELFNLERSNAELTRNLKTILTKINVSLYKNYINI